MSRFSRSEHPVVTLEQGATPGGNRCPACESPLFAWLEIKAEYPGEATRTIDRCERCGLGCGRDAVPSPVQAETELLAEAGANGEGAITLRVPNAASVQAWLGAESWSELRRDGRALQLTPAAIELILERSGAERPETRQMPRRGMATMWQTILNLITFNRDFARRAVTRELRPSGGRGRAAFAIDTLITIFLAAPVAVLAVVIEGVAMLARRGGAIEVRAIRRPAGASRSA